MICSLDLRKRWVFIGSPDERQVIADEKDENRGMNSAFATGRNFWEASREYTLSAPTTGEQQSAVDPLIVEDSVLNCASLAFVETKPDKS